MRTVAAMRAGYNDALQQADSVMADETQVIAVIGGTGELGGAIARRLALAGQRVVIGSRDPAKALAAAQALAREAGCQVGSGSNADAAYTAQIVIVTSAGRAMGL